MYEYMLTGEDIENVVERNAEFLMKDENYEVEYIILNQDTEFGLLEIEGTVAYKNFSVERTITSIRSAVVERGI